MDTFQDHEYAEYGWALANTNKIVDGKKALWKDKYDDGEQKIHFL